MAAANKVRVSRVKLIEKLQAKLAATQNARDARFDDWLAEEIANAKERVEREQARLASLKKAKGPEDLDMRYERWWKDTSYLEKTLSLLEMSDEETIDVGPTSDLYQLL